MIFCRNEIRSGTLEASPSLGIVLSQLKNCVEYYNREKHAYDVLLRQRSSLATGVNINSEGKKSLSQFLSTQLFNFHATQCIDQLQYDNLAEKLLYKQQELKYSVFITENCLYLLWAHLDYYMLRAISVNSLQNNSSLLRECKYKA